MRQSIINFLKSIGLDNPVRWLYTRTITVFWHLCGTLSNRNIRFLNNYKSKHKIHKLHLGCGLNYLDNWLNTDLKPDSKRIYLDISKKFSFPDNSFDYVYSEHVIEHMPYLSGKNMLEQSFRVLKSGGTLRLVTPDILFLIDLYQNDKTKINSAYIKWNSELFIQGKAPHCALSVINNYVRDWGHQYIYDVNVLRNALTECGFENIKELELGKSDISELQNLEHASRHPEGFLALESLVIEATKPMVKS
jgi:predicted SAM-dependent methyltransferase